MSGSSDSPLGALPSRNFVEHPLIKPGTVECRTYQETLLAIAAKKNTLCIVPTGTGKTILALMLAALRLGKFPDSFAIIAAPSKPLAEQHFATFRDMMAIEEGSVVSVTGKMSPTERGELYSKGRLKVLCCTPQTLQNDIISGRLSLKGASLLVVDEAHRACGNYPYQFIAQKYMLDSRNPLILAITASPGSSEEKIREVCSSLSIDAVEVRSASDADVCGFVNPVRVEWRKLELPSDFLNIKKLLDAAYRLRLSTLKQSGVIASLQGDKVKKRDLLSAQGKLLAGERGPEVWTAISLLAEAIKLEHAIELLETQGVRMLRDYFEKLKRSDRSKAARKIVSDPLVCEAERLLSEITYEHPKLDELASVVKDQIERDEHSRIIVFSSYRSSVGQIVDFLGKIGGCRPVALVGQAELSQKEQARVLNEFKSGGKNVLVGSCIAEEGLHVAGCELAVLYEPVPSALRSIQRRGRIGRTGAGRLVVLMAKDTRDERNYWISESREKKMKSILKHLKLENKTPTTRGGSLERWMQPTVTSQ